MCTMVLSLVLNSENCFPSIEGWDGVIRHGCDFRNDRGGMGGSEFKNISNIRVNYIYLIFFKSWTMNLLETERDKKVMIHGCDFNNQEGGINNENISNRFSPMLMKLNITF